MTRFFVLCCLSLALVSITASEAAARGPRFRRTWPQHPPVDMQNQAVWRQQQFNAPQRHNPYEYYKQWYPKYYGGFHSSVILRNGYPGNETRLRGYAW